MDHLQPRTATEPYVLRSEDTSAAIYEVCRQRPGYDVRTEVPSDFVVSRDFRSAYMIAKDGSRRRLDPQLAAYVVDQVKSECSNG